MKRKIRAAAFIIIGFLLVFTATGIFMFYDIQGQTADENAKILLETYRAEEEKSFEIDAEIVVSTAEGEMPQKTVMDYNVVGIISVPVVSVELPVQNTWNYDLLRISACRYSGSVKGNDLIILGHNYDHHFGRLKNCHVGDKVIFTDVNGEITNYTISSMENLHKKELDKLTGTDADLTIFTCTIGGQYRIVLRCEKLES